MFKLSTSSSVTCPPNTTLLIPSDGWNYSHLNPIIISPNNGRKKWKTKKVTWWERTAERVAAEESAGGVSDHVSRSAVDVWGFLTGVLLSIIVSSSSTLTTLLPIRDRFGNKHTAILRSKNNNTKKDTRIEREHSSWPRLEP